VCEISIPRDKECDILVNQIHYKHAIDMLAFVGLGITSDIKQRDVYGGAHIDPIYPPYLFGVGHC